MIILDILFYIWNAVNESNSTNINKANNHYST